MTHCLQLFTMEPFLYLDETMQHTIQDSRDGEWQTLITMAIVKWHRAVLSKEIVSQC